MRQNGDGDLTAFSSTVKDSLFIPVKTVQRTNKHGNNSPFDIVPESSTDKNSKSSKKQKQQQELPVLKFRTELSVPSRTQSKLLVDTY